MSKLGLYLHVPFCKSKCTYCDFYSLPHSEGQMDDYLSTLQRHLAETAPAAAAYTVDTVYFGGGTPSYWGTERLCAALETVQKHYRLASDAEITLEANPDSACDAAALERLHQAGFNRLSLGVQSADEAALRRIGRIHTFAQVVQAVASARAAGFDNVSVDLIYGLPGQTLPQWEATLDAVLTLQPEHISCYGLRVEEGTPLWRQRQTADLPDDDAQADMYLFAVDLLAQHGYEQYEISNFSLPGRESRHNLRYWQLSPYLGFGPGAHSDFGGERFAWERDLAAYLRGERRMNERTAITPDERRREYVMLSLRTAAGFDAETFAARFGGDAAAVTGVLADLERHGLTAPTPHGRRLTPRGFLVSNAVIAAAWEAL